MRDKKITGGGRTLRHGHVVTCSLVFMVGLIRNLGSWLIGRLAYLGQLAGLADQIRISMLRGKWRPRLLGEQLVATGFGSQLVVITTGAFVGAVFGFQIFAKFRGYALESATGAMVSVAMCRELGPVVTALMVAGRVGSSMAAEIGTMKVTEQIDALRALGVNPVDYLVTPRLLAMMVSMPLLIAEAIAFGILLSYVVVVEGFGVPVAYYRNHTLDSTNMEDVSIGMIKGFVFGIIIVIISCHQGLHAENGAVGVGRSTTEAMVISALWVLIVNFFLSLLLNIVFPYSSAA
jgi:phospholipid/cholesterol/gamma-HCH transport system permease protein